MKKQGKRMILCAAFLAVTASGFSQLAFGPKAGINFTNFVDKTTMNEGVDVGIFLRLGKTLYFQPEFEYSFNSSYLKDIWEGDDFDRIETHYLNIPVMIGYKLLNSSLFNFRFFIGPRIGFMVKNNFSENENPFGTLQIGGRVGLGIDIWRFVLDGCYDFSGNQPNSDLESTKWRKQNKFCISLGFKLFKE